MTPLRELEAWWHEHGRTGHDELWDIVGRVIVNEQEACAAIADAHMVTLGGDVWLASVIADHIRARNN